MTDKLVLGVYIVQNSVSVRLMAGGEDNDLEIFGRLLEAFDDVGPNIYSSVDRLVLGLEVDLEHYIWLLRLNIVDAVDQRLVHIEDT